MPSSPKQIARRPLAGRNRGGRRRGFLTFEIILLLPVLLVVILAIVEFSMLLLLSQAVAGAASVVARQATLPGSEAVDVEAAVAQALAGWKFAADADTAITVNGIPETISPLSMAVTGDVIGVTVEVPSTAAVPDLLSYIGISLSGKKLMTTYVVRRE